jgi:hypothetical protein
MNTERSKFRAAPAQVWSRSVTLRMAATLIKELHFLLPITYDGARVGVGVRNFAICRVTSKMAYVRLVNIGALFFDALNMWSAYTVRGSCLLFFFCQDDSFFGALYWLTVSHRLFHFFFFENCQTYVFGLGKTSG